MANRIGIMELFAGSGYHGEAVCAALRYLGFEPRVLGYVEREAQAACWLLDRMEASALERAPVWAADLAELGDGDCRDMRGHVDIIVASPPCGPYSAAGKQRGNADERSFGDGDGPLVHTLRIIAAVRPALVWFENVGEWVTEGHFREFGEQLSGMGYDIAPPVFLAAEDVGAPHERERVYILCRLADAEQWGRWVNQPGRRSDRRGAAERTGADVGDAANARPNDENGRRTQTEIGAGRVRESAGSAYRVVEREGGGFGADGQPSERDGFTDGRGQQLADGCEQLADGARERLQGQSADGCEAANDGDAGRSGRAAFRTPMFPPGRGNGDDELARYVKRAPSTRAIGERVRGVAGDFRCWAELLAAGLDPALMPAAERELLVLADGMGYSNAEKFRLGGNGIVPLAVAAAFVAAFLGMQEVTT